jgi:hypothetical protein
VTLYDPERDRVRAAGRWLRWAARWVIVPAALGVFVGGNVDVRALPFFGDERLSAVLLLDGQAYFGHLDDSGETGTIVLRDVYYFKDAQSGPSGLAVGLVRRGTEAHEPADGMRINRDRVLALERVGLASSVGSAIAVDREIAKKPRTLSLNEISVAGPQSLGAQRVAAEHDIQRAWVAAAAQLAKLNDLVLPVTKSEAQAITEKAVADLRTVRRNALGAIGSAVGMSPADAEAYVRTTDPVLETQTYADEASVLLAPDLDGVVNRAVQLYAQVGDAAAKQLTQPKAAAPSPSSRP